MALHSPSATKADILAELELAQARIEQLEAALSAACVMAHGYACFKTTGGIPMGMPKSTERIVRPALESIS